MPLDIKIDPKTTAVLIMDYQHGIVERYSEDKKYLESAASLLKTARAKAIPVIYAVIGFRPGYPEVSEENPIFGSIKSTGRFAHGTPDAEIHASVSPQDGDIIVTKHRVGAFQGTDLDMILRANQIDTLLLFGIATSGIVLSTIRFAADLDYKMICVEDLCIDADEEVHRVLTQKVFPRQAIVTSSVNVAEALQNL